MFAEYGRFNQLHPRPLLLLDLRIKQRKSNFISVSNCELGESPVTAALNNMDSEVFSQLKCDQDPCFRFHGNRLYQQAHQMGRRPEVLSSHQFGRHALSKDDTK